MREGFACRMREDGSVAETGNAEASEIVFVLVQPAVEIQASVIEGTGQILLVVALEDTLAVHIVKQLVEGDKHVLIVIKGIGIQTGYGREGQACNSEKLFHIYLYFYFLNKFGRAGEMDVAGQPAFEAGVEIHGKLVSAGLHAVIIVAQTAHAYGYGRGRLADVCRKG